MIGINKLNVNRIPMLSVTKINNTNERLPTLIFYHGFTSGKENNLTIGYLLAEKGYRVIFPDCEHHGERFSQVTEQERELLFWDIVIQSIEELLTIKSYLKENDLLLNERIGVAGTSMGGMITAGALTMYSWIKCAGLLMSSSKLQSFAQILIDNYNENNESKISNEEKRRVLNKIEPYDLYYHIDKLNKRPLFLWHGKDDDVVPFHHTEKLVQKVKEYTGNKDHVKVVLEVDRGHHVSRPAIIELTNYFAQHL